MGKQKIVREMAGFADITGVADINVAAAVAAGGPSHFVGPFSGANAAFGYLPLQLALRPEVRKLKLVRGKACFADAYGRIVTPDE